MAEATTPDEVREKLLSAASAAGAAITGIAELLRHGNVDGVPTWAKAYDVNPDGELLPLGEDIIEPLIDALALALAIDAGGLVRPLHRIAGDLMRFQLGDDD